MNASWIIAQPFSAMRAQHRIAAHGPDAGPDPLAGDRHMPLRDFVAELEAARSAADDPLIAWQMGETFELADLGQLGCTVAQAPTLGAALRCFQQGFFALQSGAEVRLDVDGSEAHFHYRILDSRIWPRRADAELTLGVLAGIVRRYVPGEPMMNGVSFEHAPCAARRQIADKVSCQLRYDAGDNTISLPLRLLDRRRSDAAATDTAFRDSLQALDRHVQELRRAEPLPDRVRLAIFERIGRAPLDQDSIARVLGLSERSLRRHLESNGTSFQELTEECRRIFCHALLVRSAVPLSEIAFRLGYSDQTAFSRAFSRWYGASPRALRQAGDAGESVIR